jgi:RNA polymerase sigma-70 factor (ECF subfamily)
MAASHAPDKADAVDLERALARLGAQARAVVWLHDVEGYTHAEIGALFGASASFSKSQLARAHERLRDLLQTGGGNAPCVAMSGTS